MIRCFPLRMLHQYVIVSVFLFAGIEGLKYFSVPAPNWIFSYLNDFLAIPIVATLSLYGVWYIKGDKTIRIHGIWILALVVLFSVYFEYYLPRTSDCYTGDFWDVVCYGAGGSIFYILQKLE